MTDEQKDCIREYEKVKLGILSLETRAAELKEVIMPLMQADEKIQLTEGKLYLKPMPKWTFSSHVTQLDEELKETKKREQADGTATKVDNFVLEYRRDKNESPAAN